MQTYRLVIGPDGKVKIPDGEPGRTVTVVVEEPSRSIPSESLKPVAAMTREERERLNEEFLERGRRIRARLKDASQSVRMLNSMMKMVSPRDRRYVRASCRGVR